MKNKLLPTLRAKSKILRFIKMYLRHEVDEYKSLNDKNTHEWDDVICLGRRELAEGFLDRIEEYEVQWYEFFGCWVRMERSEHTDNDIMITVHPDEDSDYIGKLVVSNSYLGSKLEKL